MRARADDDAGFTLVEVLIALALAGVAMTLSAMAFRTIAGTANRAHVTIDRIEAIARGTAALRTDLARIERQTALNAQSRRAERGPRQGPNGETLAEFVFTGEPTGTSFVVRDGDFPTAPGTYLTGWRIEKDGATHRLVRRRAPFDPSVAPARALQMPAVAETEVIVLDGPWTMAFSYLTQSSSSGQPVWVNRWNARDRLPEAIRFEARSTQPSIADLPTVLVRLRIDAENDCIVAVKGAALKEQPGSPLAPGQGAGLGDSVRQSAPRSPVCTAATQGVIGAGVAPPPGGPNGTNRP